MKPPELPNIKGAPFSTPRLSANIEREVMHMAIRETSAKTIEQIPAEKHFQFQHGKKWNHLLYENGKPCEQVGEMILVSSQIAIGIDRIVKQDQQMIPEFVEGISNSMAHEMNSGLCETMFDAATKSGTVFEFPRTGIPLTQYMEIIAKCDCSVAEDGAISRPELFYIPSQLRLQLNHDLEDAPPEFKQQLEALWQQKEQEARDREHARLSRYELDL